MTYRRTKKPDAQTVVEAFQSSTKTTTHRMKSSCGLPFGGINQIDGIKNSATNEACEDLNTNPQSRNNSATVTPTPWINPVKSPDVINTQNNSTRGSIGSMSLKLQGNGVVPLTSLITATNQVRRSSRVSYFEVTSNADEEEQKSCSPDLLIDLEGDTENVNDVDNGTRDTPTASERSSITEEEKVEKKRLKDNDKKKKKNNKNANKIEVKSAEQNNEP